MRLAAIAQSAAMLPAAAAAPGCAGADRMAAAAVEPLARGAGAAVLPQSQALAAVSLQLPCRGFESLPRSPQPPHPVS